MSGARGFVYGPVPSRRLGSSLGIDVVPMKACPYDCIYCQLGPTRERTVERRAFFPVEEILADVERRLGLWPPPDVVTVAGSGEPTLLAGLGELIAGLKRLTTVPVALLTNGALFRDPGVRADALAADLVLPSLDAGDEPTFQRVNRPAPGLTLAGVVAGLAELRRAYHGEIWLEVMVLDGINDSPRHLRRVAELVRRFAPDRIQLNTAVRPTFDERAAPVPPERLAGLCGVFDPVAEVIAEWHRGDRAGGPASRPLEDDVRCLLERRPCTLEDVADGLGEHANEVLKVLGGLERSGLVHRVVRDGHLFWHAIPSRSGGVAEGRP